MIATDAFAIQNAMIGSDLSASARAVLNAFISFTNQVGECFPSVSALVEKCGFCERTVRSKIKELTCKGWLVKTEQFRRNGSQTSNFYIIKQPKAIMAQESTEEPIVQPTVAEDHQDIVDPVDAPAVQTERCVAQKKAQKKEASLGKATLPMTSAHESSTCIEDDKLLGTHMSRGFLGQLKNFILNIKNDTKDARHWIRKDKSVAANKQKRIPYVKRENGQE